MMGLISNNIGIANNIDLELKLKCCNSENKLIFTGWDLGQSTVWTYA